MRQFPTLLVSAIVVFAAGANAAGAHLGQFRIAATLDSKQAVPKPPHPVPRATGVLTGALAPGTGSVRWKLVFGHLSGRATAAEIHLANRGADGPVAITLCGPKALQSRRVCRSGMRGTARARPRTVLALQSGAAYVNLHTRKNPAGEIRGQILTARRTQRADAHS